MRTVVRSIGAYGALVTSSAPTGNLIEIGVVPLVERSTARGVRIPTLMVFRDGIQVFAQPGALNERQLEQLIDGARGLDMDDVRAEVAAQQDADGQSAGAGA